jgi:hypothetical protein
MRQVISAASQIAVLRTIDETYSVGGGPISIGATVVRATKGRPFAITRVQYNTWQAVYGTPYPNNVGQHMEGLRHLYDAAKECQYVNVVRVVADDAAYPSISARLVVDKGAWVTLTDYVVNDVVEISGGALLICVTLHTSDETEPTAADAEWEAYTDPAETDAHIFSTLLALGAGYLGQFWVIDGDESVNRSITISDIDDTKERFQINFWNLDGYGEKKLEEYHVVGVGMADRDDMGRSAYIQTVLAERSNIFRCNWDDSKTWAEVADTLAGFLETTFTGGTGGGEPTAQNWTDAWDIFRDETVAAYLMFAAGNYDETVIANCIAIAATRRVSFFFDSPPYLDSTATLAWLLALGVETQDGAAYYCPWKATDQWYGGKTIWGASGSVVAACAKGDANMTGETPGVHYSPAGSTRGRLARVGLEPVFPADTIDINVRDTMVAARLNPVVSCDDGGGAMIDDAVTLWFKENYSRFVWVKRIEKYIEHRFIQMATQAKHEPDGVTHSRLDKGMRQILDDLVISGALVQPRAHDFEEDTIYGYTVGKPTNDNPYVYSVAQQDIDLFLVVWAFCPTGSSRRIVGQPIMLK